MKHLWSWKGKTDFTAVGSLLCQPSRIIWEWEWIQWNYNNNNNLKTRCQCRIQLISPDMTAYVTSFWCYYFNVRLMQLFLRTIINRSIDNWIIIIIIIIIQNLYSAIMPLGRLQRNNKRVRQSLSFHHVVPSWSALFQHLIAKYSRLCDQTFGRQTPGRQWHWVKDVTATRLRHFGYNSKFMHTQTRVRW